MACFACFLPGAACLGAASCGAIASAGVCEGAISAGFSAGACCLPLACFACFSPGATFPEPPSVERPLPQAPARERSRQAVPQEPPAGACAVLPVSRQRELPFREPPSVERLLAQAPAWERSVAPEAVWERTVRMPARALVRGASAFSSALALRIVHLHLRPAPGNAAVRRSYRRTARARACRNHRPKQRAAPTPSARRELCLQESGIVSSRHLSYRPFDNTRHINLFLHGLECGARRQFLEPHKKALETNELAAP